MTYTQVTKDELEQMNDTQVATQYQSLIEALVIEVREINLPFIKKDLKVADLGLNRNQLEERLLRGQEQYLLAKNPTALAEKL
jgi:hypothetical protein